MEFPLEGSDVSALALVLSRSNAICLATVCDGVKHTPSDEFRMPISRRRVESKNAERRAYVKIWATSSQSRHRCYSCGAGFGGNRLSISSQGTC